MGRRGGRVVGRPESISLPTAAAGIESSAAEKAGQNQPVKITAQRPRRELNPVKVVQDLGPGKKNSR